ncbi:hypothetical protein WA026_022217 [Henosepilachna vigintioctopunctata]|uniref:Sodium-dependent serotonin transporter n=1 Tax=Henosepilachna vigintioctopunctata TaxID=420089 RepID=A0AAW1UHS3_9CUCU
MRDTLQNYKCNILLTGVGYAICLMDIYMGMYYNTIIGWAVYYLIASFQSELPWVSCHNRWNTPDCRPVTSLFPNVTASSPAREFFDHFRIIRAPTPRTRQSKDCLRSDPTGHSVRVLTRFWRSRIQMTSSTKQGKLADLKVAALSSRLGFRREVLEQYKADSLNRMGPIKPALALCVFAVFVLVYFSLWKGVRSTGKVVWITALAPYVVLIILLIRGVSLPGAANGIRYYLTPEWHKLYNSKVWIDAAAQIFFSLGPGFGTLLALSSYNKFNNNCYRDALLTSTINCLTSFLAGFVIFSVLGYMAHVQHKNIEQVGLEGPGLVFIVYPEAIATMSGSVFWSIIFFLMLITLGLDSTFGGLEAMITALCDEYPRTLGRHREIFVACLLFGIYICALPTTTYVSR